MLGFACHTEFFGRRPRLAAHGICDMCLGRVHCIWWSGHLDDRNGCLSHRLSCRSAMGSSIGRRRQTTSASSLPLRPPVARASCRHKPVCYAQTHSRAGLSRAKKCSVEVDGSAYATQHLTTFLGVPWCCREMLQAKKEIEGKRDQTERDKLQVCRRVLPTMNPCGAQLFVSSLYILCG